MTTSLLSSMIVAAPEPMQGPDLEDAITTAYDWHQGGGGLYAFASNGGTIKDETVRETALQELEEAMAYVQSRTTDIDAGALPEFKTDVATAEAKGTSASGYIMGRLENLKAVLNQDKPETQVTDAPHGEMPLGGEPAPAPVTGSRTAATIVSVEVFNKARQTAQAMFQQLQNGSNKELGAEVARILYALDHIEARAGGNLTQALDAEESPETANQTRKLIQDLSDLHRQVASTPEAPAPAGAQPDPVMASLEVTADLVDNTVRSVVQFVRVNLDRFKRQLKTPQGEAAVREELSNIPGGQMAGPVTPLVQQLALGAIDENGFVAKLEQLFRRTSRSASSVMAFLVESKLATDHTRVKQAVDGSVHVMGLKTGAATLRNVMKFASSQKVAIKLVKAFEEDGEEATCPECGGPGVPLGALGNRQHFRCRDCGSGFNHEAENAPKFAAETQQPELGRAEELPYTEGGTPARVDETVFSDLHTAAGPGMDGLPSAEVHIIKVGARYLALTSDADHVLILVPKQAQATRFTHEVAKLWMDDDRFGNLVASEAQPGEEGRIVRIVPKQASAKTALIPPAPSAAGNHAGPANPVNPTGTPAPVAPAPVAQPAPVQPSTQGPAVTHINPGGATPQPPQPPAPPQPPQPPMAPGQQPQQVQGSHKEAAVEPTATIQVPGLGAVTFARAKSRALAFARQLAGAIETDNYPAAQYFLSPDDGGLQTLVQALRGAASHTASSHTASEGTLNGVLSEVEGTVSQLQELADAALAKARLLNDESLVAAAERMNTAIFEAGMAARHAKGLANGTKGKDEPKKDEDDEGQKPGELKEASAKTACSGAGCSGDCDGNCKGECKGDCPSCKKKASAKTADNAELSSMAREVVLDWAATHPKQTPDWASPEWRQLYEQNRAEAPDENQFLQACQRAYGEMAKSMNKQGSRIMAALALQARGLMGPTAEEGDSVENAVKFIHGNAKDIEDETVAGLRQILGDAGYDRTNAEMAIEEVFGEEATLANGALLKTLLKGEG